MSDRPDSENFIHFLTSFNHSSLSTNITSAGDDTNTVVQPLESAVNPTLLPHSSSASTPTPPPAPITSPELPPDPHAKKRILAYVIVDRPSHTVRTQNRKSKVVKQEPFIFGPVSIPNNVTLDPLLSILSTVVQARPQDIDINSLSWKHQKPRNSGFLPLRDEAGVHGMLSQVLSRAKPGVDYVVDIKLDPPRQSQVQLPWNNPNVDTESTSSGGLGSRTIPGSNSMKTIDEILGASLDGEIQLDYSPTMTKGKYDVVVSDLKDQIYEKYPRGNCPEHPKARCVVQPVTGNHFDVDEARALTWAAKMKADAIGIDLENPPFGSHLWKPNNALRRVMKSNANAMSSASLPLPAPAPAVTDATSVTSAPPPANMGCSTSPSFPPYPYPFPTGVIPATPSPHMYSGPPPSYFAPYLPMMPPFMNPYVTPPSSTPACDVSRGTKRTSDVRSSSPTMSSNVISLKEFCVRYGFSDSVLAGLKELDFVPGDRLSIVSEKEYMDAGFTTLSWHRVVRANKEYISSLATLR